ncbi:transposase domain-containing protein [Sedimentitalea nanhaiensis]|uniref:transposase domain-containing protein n=1 Tax=Sedimentitalea nanhaiensis TaxID=999627 RepID=UPI000944F251|nr:transposase domain-containing protein [Sedimentitalea nanhaiensis]
MNIERNNYRIAGCESGGNAAVVAYPAIETARPNGLDPQTWRTRVLARIADRKITRLDKLLLWRYAATAAQKGTIRPRQSGQTEPLLLF